MNISYSQVEQVNKECIYTVLDTTEAMLDAMSRDETTTPEQMVEAVRAMKKRYQGDGA